MLRAPVGVAGPPRGSHRPAAGSALLDAAVRSARSGSEQAFTALFHEFQPRLLRYLRTRCGDAAQDVAAETWVAVVTDIHRFRGDSGEFARWLFTIARYRAIDHARAAARRPTALPEGYEAAARDDVQQAVVESAQAEHILRLLRRLPADQAEAVALRVLAGLDVHTVAGLLGKSDNAVRICTHRGLRRLEATLFPEKAVSA